MAADAMGSAGSVRRGPIGACSDTALLEQIRAQSLGSRLHGEGYRKIWARLRHGGIRTSARRVRRLMGQHGRPEQRAQSGTITTTAVNALWARIVMSKSPWSSPGRCCELRQLLAGDVK